MDGTELGPNVQGTKVPITVDRQKIGSMMVNIVLGSRIAHLTLVDLNLSDMAVSLNVGGESSGCNLKELALVDCYLGIG